MLPPLPDKGMGGGRRCLLVSLPSLMESQPYLRMLMWMRMRGPPKNLLASLMDHSGVGFCCLCATQKSSRVLHACVHAKHRILGHRVSVLLIVWLHVCMPDAAF